MINALFSSKSDGTMLFRHGKDKSSFGWATIVDMYTREVDRARQQQTHMVPRLKEVHVLRDAWAKLNVSPAKIMQVLSLIFVMCVDCIYVTTARTSFNGAVLLYTPGSPAC